MQRRSDIQGLRALAVLAVVAFHAGLPLPGGFVGVDVFFVISGFVITSMLRREFDATGRIDFPRFYLRRFKRLTPALALVVVATTATAALVLSPLGPQQTVSETARGAMLLVANWVIAGNTGGYFDAPAASNPLLHSWSLSVEEQFYLVFPVILALSWWRRSPAVAAVGAVACSSFACAVIGVNPFVHSWLLSFYSPLTRAWEFALGALLALAASRVAIRSAPVAFGVGLLGVGMLVESVSLINDGTPFPGTWTLLPVGAALLLILCGTHASNLVTRTLGSRPLARVGDWSYSIYLWHWPFIVFAGVLWPGSDRAKLLAAAASLAPAIASYTFVEQPLRTLQRLPRRRLALVVAAVVVTPVVLAGVMGSVATRFWTPRYESGAMPVANQGDLGQDEFYRVMGGTSFPCTAPDIREHALRWNGFLRCQQSKPGPKVTLALIGDSHAEHLFVGLADELARDNVAYYIVDAPPVTTDADFARIVHDVTASTTIETVVVSADWSSRGVHGPELRTTLDALSKARKSVFVTDDVPSFTFDPFECKYRQALFLPSDCTASRGDFQRDYEHYYPELLQTVRQVPGAHMLNTARWFCNTTTCDMARNGKLLYRDYNHLNVNGSDYVARELLSHYPAFAAAALRAG